MQLFVDNLTNVDFSYLCPNRGLVGETWLASIELTGELDHQGMICDFGVVKKRVREWLDSVLDHCLLVPSKDSRVSCDQKSGIKYVTLQYGMTHIACEAPGEAITFVDTPTIEPQAVAAWCNQQLAELFGRTVEQIRLSFSAEQIDSPYYHYSHGLKKHQGNCQRIAHGHRSKILIWRNGRLCTETMERWSRLWRDIYIGSSEDIVSVENNLTLFSYQAQQGEFRLEIPSHRCYILDTDTTVELIAKYIADTLQRETPGDHITVKAYEGIGKGAIATEGPNESKRL